MTEGCCDTVVTCFLKIVRRLARYSPLATVEARQPAGVPFHAGQLTISQIAPKSYRIIPHQAAYGAGVCICFSKLQLGRLRTARHFWRLFKSALHWRRNWPRSSRRL